MSVNKSEVSKSSSNQNIPEEHRHTDTQSYTAKIMILGIAVVGIASYYMLFLHISCKYVMEPSIITNILSKKLYGQDRAIKEISEAMKSSEDIRIMIFTGGTGQGKSYAAQLITHHPLKSNNIHIILKRDFTDMPNNFGSAVHRCDYNIIVIDDLTLDDVAETAAYVENIRLLRPFKGKLDIIMIFNIEDVSLDLVRIMDTEQSHKFIGEHFKGVPINLVTFLDMDRKSIRNCVRDALLESYIYSHEKVDKVMTMLSPDVKGCKEVYSKISLV